jgi:hypothetical protein
MSEVSLIKFDDGDYLVRHKGTLIGVVQKLIKGGWVCKSHIDYSIEIITKTRKEGIGKLMEIVNQNKDESR